MTAPLQTDTIDGRRPQHALQGVISRGRFVTVPCLHLGERAGRVLIQTGRTVTFAPDRQLPVRIIYKNQRTWVPESSVTPI